MGTRYVYWRTPEGKPYKDTDGKYAPHALLASLGKHTSAGSSGAIPWPFFETYHLEMAIESSAVIIAPNGSELNETDSLEIMSHAIREEAHSKGAGQPLLASHVISNADRIAASYFKRPRQSYFLLTALSVETLPAKRIKIGNCEVSAYRASRHELPESLKKLTRSHSLIRHLESTKYLKVKVATSGRTVYEAADKALDAVHLLRGLWALYATYGSWSINLGPPKHKPIGQIHTGPIHTLHRPDGSPATDIYWFQPDYTADHALFKPKHSWQETEKDRRRAVRRIIRQSYRKDLERLIIRYALALDQSDASLAFLQMWSILETITSTVGARYDETIARTTWIFRDRQVEKGLLEHLRFRRNQYVHAAVKPEGQEEQIVYMIKFFIEPHLVQLIENHFGVDSLSEYGTVLSLPTDVKALEKRRDHLQKALKIWREVRKHNEH